MTFYGFIVNGDIELDGLSIIKYDNQCADIYESQNNTEESCYSYGTTVVRRSQEGKNETILIEEVQEGD